MGISTRLIKVTRLCYNGEVMGDKQKGFTIIEVILFVAISGLLTSMLMVGVSMSINRQQYRDSVQSYAGFLRSEYSKVVNVENDRSRSVCPIDGADGRLETLRGQSECVIVGRYITTVGALGSTDGTSYKTYPVYAHRADKGSAWAYRRGAESSDYSVNWQVKTRFANQHKNNAYISILMYRHPETGQLDIRTDVSRFGDDLTNFVNNKNSAGIIQSGGEQRQQREICVYDDDWLPGERLSVFLRSYAGSADAVVIGNATGGCADA